MRSKNAFIALAWMLLASGVGFANQLPEQKYSKSRVSRMFLDAHSPSNPPAYSRSEVKKMILDAKTPNDFARLADYFDYRAMEFEQKSQEQAKELQRLLALPYHARSYPAQVDYTRDLIKRYKAQAQECSARADSYRERAETGSETTGSGVVPTR